MEYHSILFETADNDITVEAFTMPEFFEDLNLDQIFQEIVAGKEEYDLKVFFYSGLKSISAINYRLEVMKELESTDILNSMITFSGKMKRIKEYVGFSEKIHNPYQREKWLLDAASLYCDSILNLHESFISMNLQSKGLNLFNEWLTEYIASDNFKNLLSDTNNLSKEFGSIKYSVQLGESKLVVDCDENEEDYCLSINNTFEHINEVAFDYKIRFFTDVEMCALENNILEIIRDMNIETFNKLEEYVKKHSSFLDDTIKIFDREIQFYVSFIEYIGKLKRNGLNFAYPCISHKKRLDVSGGYDLALAFKNLSSGTNTVSNDFNLDNGERIYILTGPNQGGKTTFARAFGQILFLASIGCPVPCRRAELFLYDHIFTHFSTEENLSTNAGRLKEELLRLKTIMDNVTTNSIVIINELFATTTSHDAYTMGKKVLDYFISLDCICLYVTHIHELVQISERTVSLIATVNSDQEAVRTYKIIRKPADGCAYANSIVEKYSLSYSQIKERIKK